MLVEDALKFLLHKSEFTRLDRVLFCLAVDVDRAKAVKGIKAIAQAAGLQSIKKWNVSEILGRSKGLAIRTTTGWG